MRVGRRALALVAITVASPGCGFSVGAEPSEIPARVTARGALVDVRLEVDGSPGERTLTGELLEVRQDELFVLGDSIWLVQFDAIRDVDVRDHLYDWRGEWGRRLPDRLRGLRPVSRYPHGMSEDVLTRLLTAFGQRQPVRIAREVEP